MQILGVRKAEEWEVCDERHWVQNFEVGASARPNHRPGPILLLLKSVRFRGECPTHLSRWMLKFCPNLGLHEEAVKTTQLTSAHSSTHCTTPLLQSVLLGVLCFLMSADSTLPVLGDQWFTTKKKFQVNNVTNNETKFNWQIFVTYVTWYSQNETFKH